MAENQRMNFLNFIKSKRLTSEYLVLIYRFAIVMLLYSIGRILFFCFNRSLFGHVDFSSFLRIMRGGFMFDTSAVLYLNALYFLLFLFPFSFKFSAFYQRLIKWVFMTINRHNLLSFYP